MRISDWTSDVCSSDLPDLRNPLVISDVSAHFTGSGFGRFADIVAAGDVVRAVPAPATAEQSRKFFDDMHRWPQGAGFSGLGHATRQGGDWGGPIGKHPGPEQWDGRAAERGLGPDDALFFAPGTDAVGAGREGKRG